MMSPLLLMELLIQVSLACLDISSEDAENKDTHTFSILAGNHTSNGRISSTSFAVVDHPNFVPTCSSFLTTEQVHSVVLMSVTPNLLHQREKF